MAFKYSCGVNMDDKKIVRLSSEEKQWLIKAREMADKNRPHIFVPREIFLKLEQKGFVKGFWSSCTLTEDGFSKARALAQAEAEDKKLQAKIKRQEK
jgi:hypothetical protein